MKRSLIIPLALILVSALVLAGCAQEEAAPPPPPPASFHVSNLTITPPEVKTGEAVTIEVSVFNTGGSSGSYDLVLKVNNAQVETKSVTLAAKDAQRVSFSVTKQEAGSYNVDVNGLTGTFTVVVPPPPPPAGPTYTWQEAKDHIGEFATVVGPIIDTLDIGSSMLLGMGVSIYNTATVGIELEKSDLDRYPKDLFVGKTIKATGELYQNPYGGANVRVTDPSNIEVVE